MQNLIINPVAATDKLSPFLDAHCDVLDARRGTVQLIEKLLEVGMLHVVLYGLQSNIDGVVLIDQETLKGDMDQKDGYKLHNNDVPLL